jgi:spermidine/putrescine transport system substrate-binding protein
MTDISRRQVLNLGAGAVVLAAPAIIGRANPASAKEAFAGENLLVVSRAGNKESAFRETVIAPFNAKYGTKAETVGGWDQIISQIVAAPQDKPPFDITIGEEYVSSAGISQNLFQKKDWSAYPNMAGVYPWFFENRPERAKNYGVPFGGGTSLLLVRKSVGLDPTSWNLLWDKRLKGKVICDSGYWWFTLSVPTILAAKPDLSEMYDIKTAEPLFAELDKLSIARWYKDGAEQANLLNQGEADASTSYSSDAYQFLKQDPDEYLIAAPKEGVAAWSDWYFKVRGTIHGELADVFLDYMLSKETQDRFLSQSLTFMSRKDVTVPDHWKHYPASNEDYHRMFKLLTMDGWDMLNANYQAYDDRLKKTIAATTKG